MLVELSIMPLGSETHLSSRLAEILKMIDASGLAYQLTPMGTCLEGNWDEVMTLVRRCHEKARQFSPHVVTMLKIEDDENAVNKLTTNVQHVEEKVGHPLLRIPAVAVLT